MTELPIAVLDQLARQEEEITKLREQLDRLVDALKEAMYSNSTDVCQQKANAILAEIEGEK